MTDGFRVSCPMCGTSIKVPRYLAGKRGKCPKCGEAFESPQEAPEILSFEPPTDGAPADLAINLHADNEPTGVPRLPKNGHPPALAIMAAALAVGVLISIVAILVGGGEQPQSRDVISEENIEPLPTPKAPATIADLSRKRVDALLQDAMQFQTVPFVNDHLIAPKTAEYFDLRAQALVQPKTDAYLAVRVFGEVDSQNRLGVPLRGDFTVDLKYFISEDRWHRSTLALDGEYVFLDDETAEAFRKLDEALKKANQGSDP